MQCDVANFVLSLRLIVGDALVVRKRRCGGGGELKRIMLHLSRVSASPALLAAVIVANKRQTKYSETESRR